MINLTENESIIFESECMRILNDAGMDIDRVDISIPNYYRMFRLRISHKTGHLHYISSNSLYGIVEQLKIYADPWLQYEEAS